MSELLIVGYDDETTATRVLDELQALQREYLVDLEDAAVIVRNQKGKILTTRWHTVRSPACSGVP